MPHAEPERAAEFLPHLHNAMREFEIDENVQRESAFLANVAHESNSLLAVSENLNYSAEGLRRTWPSRFTAELAREYARQPERIANLVYANRMGNGDEASGDGWRYRGAGLIQVTGADNHHEVASSLVIPAGEVGDWMRTPEGASRSAGWFWRRNGLNELADIGDQRAICKRINGGLNGLKERTAYYERALAVLA